MKQQQALNCEQYSQIFSPIERKLCHQLRLSSLAALRLNMSWLDCVGEKKKALLCTSCGRVHCVSFYLCGALEGVTLYLSGHMKYLNAPRLERCFQSALLITCNTRQTVFSSPSWPHLTRGRTELALLCALRSLNSHRPGSWGKNIAKICWSNTRAFLSDMNPFLVRRELLSWSLASPGDFYCPERCVRARSRHECCQHNTESLACAVSSN